MKNIQITVDWIFANFTDRVIYHESKNVILTAKIFNKDYCWIELALNSMNIEHAKYEFEFDKEIHYTFNLEYVKELAPEFYKKGERILQKINL